MAKLTRKDVLHVAKLAKLKLTDKEVEKYLQQLAKVVDYISQLSEVDTTGVEPTSQTTGLENVFRPDVVKTDQSLSHSGHFVVEAVIKK